MPKARGVLQVAAGLGLLTVLTGCVHGGVTVAPWPDDPIAASRQSADAPVEFRMREPLPSCGNIELGQGEIVPDAAWECMNAAFESGAELAVVQPTTEGDPIVTFYRVGPSIRGMDVITDSTLDTYGFGWLVQRCVDTFDAREPAGC
jgi:hypothetical protein